MSSNVFIVEDLCLKQNNELASGSQWISGVLVVLKRRRPIVVQRYAERVVVV
jgi:hypothetical protein